MHGQPMYGHERNLNPLTDAVLSVGCIDREHSDISRVGVIIHLLFRLAYDRPDRALPYPRLVASGQEAQAAFSIV